MSSYSSELSLDIEQEKNQEERYLVPGLVRGLAVLNLFDRVHQEMTISEIAEKLEINRSSAFRLIYTLESCGYLRKMSQKTYALDSNVMKLGFNSLSEMSLIELAMPILKELRDHVRIAVHLSILEDTNILFIHNLQSTELFTSNIHIGTRWPAHATVIGQLLLSRLSKTEIQERYAHFQKWDVFSERTPKNLDALLERLDFVKNQPYMVSWGHYNTDMAACAAPIFNQANQEMVAVLSVSCPISTYNESEFHGKVAESVILAAQKISKFIYK
ncbi:IclR family transcriptional regulator [Acinetobacter sp. ANC 4558]|uniref:IclR family transcriptional regulator n=1 Tax=Acinetobacter sp. ANC 4558 TaxID=1977876 RepID=UPI000A33D37F|nr:IclR family transcriptional regulator [Acinetobacter sp. ANC 4558]OTG85449.1 IclR family transcriptional regulator [Acinetobacter sp. ANC 4558]